MTMVAVQTMEPVRQIPKQERMEPFVVKSIREQMLHPQQRDLPLWNPVVSRRTVELRPFTKGITGTAAMVVEGVDTTEAVPVLLVVVMVKVAGVAAVPVM